MLEPDRHHHRQPFVATATNLFLAYDFVFDGCANVQKLRFLPSLMSSEKGSFFIDIGGSIRIQDLMKVLEGLTQQRIYSLVLERDDSSEFVSLARTQFATEKWYVQFTFRTQQPFA
jgi:hypothetical protein